MKRFRLAKDVQAIYRQVPVLEAVRYMSNLNLAVNREVREPWKCQGNGMLTRRKVMKEKTEKAISMLAATMSGDFEGRRWWFYGNVVF